MSGMVDKKDRDNFKSLEGVHVEAIWDSEIGHSHIVNLTYPELIHGADELTDSLTGLYLRAYNKPVRKHQRCLVLYTKAELDSDPEIRDKDTTHHLKALQKFWNVYKMKPSFCLGFAIAEDGTVKRNSCANVLSTGQRNMPVKYYEQLVRILDKACKFPVHFQAEEGEEVCYREEEEYDSENNEHDENERLIERKVREVYARLRRGDLEDEALATSKPKELARRVRKIIEEDLDAKLGIWKAFIQCTLEHIMDEEKAAEEDDCGKKAAALDDGVEAERQERHRRAPASTPHRATAATDQTSPKGIEEIDSKRFQTGKICVDGSLNMTCRENKMHDKWKCKDGFCRCGAL